MEQYILKSLKRLRKEAPKRFKELRDSCDELIGGVLKFVIALLILRAAALSEKERVNGTEGVESDADQYFEPLEAACETKQPKLMEMALDTLHFLIGRLHLLCICIADVMRRAWLLKR